MLRLSMLAVFTFACGGHSLMRNSVVMKISATEVNVCLHPGSFAVGDRIRVYQTTCSMGVARSIDCDRSQVAEGTITHALNDHYAAVQLATATRLEEGFEVELVRAAAK